MRVFVSFFAALLICLPIQAQAQVKWYSIEEAFELTKKTPKKIMIDVYTDWCGWCKVMDRETFNNITVAEYINSNFYAVKFNAEQKTDVLLNGKNYKFIDSGNRGYNELAYELLNGQLGYPSIVFLDEKTNMIQPLQGYIKVDPFNCIIKFIGEDAYKSEKWDEFQKSCSPVTQ